MTILISFCPLFLFPHLFFLTKSHTYLKEFFFSGSFFPNYKILEVREYYFLWDY